MKTIICAVLVLVAQQTKDDAVAEVRKAFEAGNDEDVILLADRAIPSVSGKVLAELSFMRGSALNALGRHKEALVAFDLAERKGYDRPELGLERAVALRGAGKTLEAEKELEGAQSLLEQDGERLSLLKDRWYRRQDKESAFESFARPLLGYDTNIVGVADDTSLADDPDRESFYYGALVSTRYRAYEDLGRVIAIEYRGEAKMYSSESDFSYIDNMIALVGRFPMQEQLEIQLRASLSDAFMAEDGHFRTVRSVGPAFLYRPTSDLEFRLWGSWGDAEYYFAAPDEQDRDGSYQQVGLDALVTLGQGWALRGFVSFLDYNAEGADYVRTEWQPGVSVFGPVIHGVQPIATVGYVVANFDEPHSLTGFTEERADRRIYVSLSVMLVGLEEKLGFAPSISVRFEDSDSNLDAYSFTRWRPQIDFSFLALAF